MLDTLFGVGVHCMSGVTEHRHSTNPEQPAMFAISKSERFAVVAFNRDNTQMTLCTAGSLEKLLTAWAKKLTWFEAQGPHNILPSFQKITVWNVFDGFTGLDLPYIKTV